MPDRRRKDRLQGLGKGHPLFRGLHADRGDGRARGRNLALRADEGRRPRQSAHRPLALCGGAAPPGQCARHIVEHGRSEEHTSELQSLMRTSYAVFCLKKKKKNPTNKTEKNSKKQRN